MNSRILWGEAETDFLVDERRWQNHDYHFVYWGNKAPFWESMLWRIYWQFNSRYSARQCKTKFQNLIKEYKVN